MNRNTRDVFRGPKGSEVLEVESHSTKAEHLNENAERIAAAISCVAMIQSVDCYVYVFRVGPLTSTKGKSSAY